MLSLNYNQRENIPMKTKKKKVTICLDPQEHSTFQNKLKNGGFPFNNNVDDLISLNDLEWGQTINCFPLKMFLANL